jgi:hypothetical protein
LNTGNRKLWLLLRRTWTHDSDASSSPYYRPGYECPKGAWIDTLRVWFCMGVNE